MRRLFTAAVLVIATSAGGLVVAGPAAAAGPWFVGPGGNNAAACTAVATRCLTVTGVLAKPAFTNGDTINVAAGTYTDRPLFQKGANVVTSGAVTFDGSNVGYAVGVLLPAGQTVTLSNMTLTRGRPANGLGGGLVIAGPSTVVTHNVTMTGNASTNQGGGAYVGAGSTLVANGGSISGNSAAVTGGALVNFGTTTINGTTVSGNAAVNAGAIYNTATMTVTGSTLNNNTAVGGTTANGGNGGAIFNINKLTVQASSFSGNRATVSSTASSATGWGGAIFNGPLSANVLPDLTITDTTIAGGAASGGNAVIGGGIANTANIFGLGGVQFPGRIVATRLTLSNNIAAAGGGIATNGATTLTDSIVDQNKATHASVGFGGGLYAARTPAFSPVPVVTVDNTDFTANTATVFGGAAALGFGVTTEIRNGSALTGNSSAFDGGAIFNSGALTVRASAVDDNDAAFQGGGIWNGSTVATDTPSLTLVNSSVAGNTAASAGGGIVTIKGATLTATDGHVSDNTAVGGGGVYVGDNASASFDGTDFRTNTASNSGGGAMLNSGTTTVTRAEITNNHALHTTGNTGLGARDLQRLPTATTSPRSSLSSRARSPTTTRTPLPPAHVLARRGRHEPDVDQQHHDRGQHQLLHRRRDRAVPPADDHQQHDHGQHVGGRIGQRRRALHVRSRQRSASPGTIIAANSGGNCNGHPVDGGYNLAARAMPRVASPGPARRTAAPQLGVLMNTGGDDADPAARSGQPRPRQDPGLGGDRADQCGHRQPRVAVRRGRPGPARHLAAAGREVRHRLGRGRPGCADRRRAGLRRLLDRRTRALRSTFTSTGTPQPTLSQTGALPPGVTFVDNGDGTATLSGTPTAVGR